LTLSIDGISILTLSIDGISILTLSIDGISILTLSIDGISVLDKRTLCNDDIVRLDELVMTKNNKFRIL